MPERLTSRNPPSARWAPASFFGLLGMLFGGISSAWAQEPGDPVEPVVTSASNPTMPAELFETLRWRSIGPYRGGRSCTATGLVGDRQTYYFGACGGGVWKSEDGGESWRNISDGSFGGSVGAVAVASSDPNVIYVGMGEKTVRGNVSSGEGIWRSTDAGRSWKHVGLTESRHIGRIRIDPTDPDRLYVAAMGHLSGPNDERGVYRSTDGGATWDRVLFANENAGAVDLILDPTNPRILYASTWAVRRTPYSLESGGDGSGLWKSIDRGDTWVELSRNEGLPKEGTLGIIGVTVSPSRPDRLYAQVEHADGGLFRSDDAGKSWTKVNSDRDLRQRAWYYTRVYADPLDADVVYVLNVGFHKSKDGGKTFERIRVPHGDNHDLWIDPHDPRRMIESNDGGVNVTYDGGATWTEQDGQPTAQFYRVITDNHVPYRIYAAQQDNSTVRISSRSDRGVITERDWEPTAGGESGHIAPDPHDPEIVYGGSYGGDLTRLDHRTGERRSVDVWPDNPMGWGAEQLRYRFQWNFPIFFSAHDPDRLFTAANVLFESRDEGETWTAISPDLTRDDQSKQGASGGVITKDNTSVEYYCTIFAATESLLRPGVLWCGSDDGLLHVTRDGGTSWSNVTPPDLPEWTLINSVEPHPFEAGGLYVAATRYKLDDFEPYLYRTIDYGATWSRIDAGIERSHFSRVIRADPSRAGLLYAGTERGIYVSFNDGATWQSFQCELPIVPITDLAVKDGDLIAATQGRGLWILDDLAHLHQLTPSRIDDAIALFTPEPVLRGGRGGGEPRGTVGRNPPSGAVIRIRLATKPGDDVESTLVIEDATGVEVRKFSSKDDLSRITLKEGMNRFEWDLRYADAQEVKEMILWGGYVGGPQVAPGDYTIRCTVGDATRVATLRVDQDPRSSSTLEEIASQVAFVLAARDKQTEAHDAIERMRALRTGVDLVLERSDDAALRELGLAIQAEVEVIEKGLYQTDNRSAQDPLNFPIRLNDKLGAVANAVASGGDFPPTASQRAVYAELAAAIDAQLARLVAIEEEKVVEFNAMASRLGVPYLRRR